METMPKKNASLSNPAQPQPAESTPATSDPKKIDNSYLMGYGKLSSLDELIKDPSTLQDPDHNAKWKSDWEKSGKKEEITKEDGLRTNSATYRKWDGNFKFPLNEYKYGLHESSIFFEDPTYLSFNVRFDTYNSPLFNYGNVESTSIVNSSAWSFLNKYSKIPEIRRRLKIYGELISSLDKIFPREDSTSNNMFVKAYYIESITGMEKVAQSRMVKYSDDGDKITIQLTEDVSLLSSYIAELYNNLSYSYKHQKYIVPENCLRFDLIIQVTDLRVFKMVWQNDEELFTELNNEPPCILYTLHDCTFDFTKSTPFDDVITNGGYSQQANNKNAVLSFDIKYKSVSKEFINKSLLADAVSISNKADRLVDKGILNKFEIFRYDIASMDNIAEEDKKYFFSYSKKNVTEKSQENVNPLTETDYASVKYNDKMDKLRQNKMTSDPYATAFLCHNDDTDKIYIPGGGEYTIRTVNLAVDTYGNSQELSCEHTRQDYAGKTEPHNHAEGKYTDNISNDTVGWQSTNDTSTHASNAAPNGLTGVGLSKSEKKGFSLPSKNKLKEGVNDWAQGVGAKLKQTTLDNVDAYKDKLLGKYREIRGALINDILRQLREPLDLPEIYPDNVYSSDFRSLSLQTFAKGLGSDLLNDITKSIPR